MSAAGSRIAAPTPPDAPSGGTVTAASATPSGCDICRMPMARPRRDRGNQPTTTLPLAALVLAAAIPPSTSSTVSGPNPTGWAHANAITAVRARPPAITQRSPYRSARPPQAISVSTRPNVGAAASSPASASGRCRSTWSSGMSSAGALMKAVVAA